MKLHDTVMRTSYLWGMYAISEWDRTTGTQGTARTFYSIGDLEDYIAAENLRWWDVVSILPLAGNRGIHYLIARA